jgi:hypothetical protein
MTRRQWIDYTKEFVGKIDPTRQFHPNMISNALSLAYENFVYDTYKYRIHELDSMGKEYDVSISRDGTSNRYYSNLPCSIIEIDKVGSGILEVSTTTGYSYSFVPMYLQEIKRISGLEVEAMTDEIGYALVGEKIYYSSMTTAIQSAGVRMTVVQQFSEYALDESIPIPKSQSERFMETVLNVLNVVRPELLLNNNTNTNAPRTEQPRQDK